MNRDSLSEALPFATTALKNSRFDNLLIALVCFLNFPPPTEGGLVTKVYAEIAAKSITASATLHPGRDYFFTNVIRDPNFLPTPFENPPKPSLARLFWKSRGLKWFVKLKTFTPSSAR